MIKLRRPAFLKSGDKVAVISPAGRIPPQKIDNAVNVLSEWGYEVVTGLFVRSAYNQFSGRDEERAADLQAMLDDPSVKAIFCARGGYGTARIIDRISLDGFIQFPKWVTGYSDITVLHSLLHIYGNSMSIHSTMPGNYPDDGKPDPSMQSLKDLLSGKVSNFNIAHHDLNHHGKGNGPVVGGNLSILYSLSATKYDIQTEGKILFLEDVGEYLYHLDRMMMNMKLTGKLKNLAGLMVGSMSEMKDNLIGFGSTGYEIIADAVSEYNYPVCFGFPAGHTGLNTAFILGKRAELSVSGAGGILKYV
ncbi:MAG: LD-carboxypeptidase [Bacteroidetes bacterium]|nr:LD-carboxypeptidase [Bacteroidota bacterium]